MHLGSQMKKLWVLKVLYSNKMNLWQSWTIIPWGVWSPGKKNILYGSFERNNLFLMGKNKTEKIQIFVLLGIVGLEQLVFLHS